MSLESRRVADVFAALDDEVKDIMSINLDVLLQSGLDEKIAKTLLELMQALRDHQVIMTELRKRNFEEVERILSERGYAIRYLETGEDE